MLYTTIDYNAVLFPYMNIEIEAKFFIESKELIRSQLKKLGAQCIQPELLMRRVVYDKHDNPQIQGTYIRIRDEGNKIRVSLKINAQSSGAISDQQELDFEVSDFDNAKEFFNAIGLTLSAYQENLRETWKYKNNEVVIDTWPCLDPYIEIESHTEEELKSAARDLGLHWEEKQIVSTDELYAQKFNVTKREALEKISYCTFQKPPIFNSSTK